MKALPKLRGWWLCAILLFGLTAGAVAAEANSAAPDPAATSNGQMLDPNDVQYDPASGMIKFIAFRKDITVREGLRMLAALCKKNIVPSPSADGPLAVPRLYNVTFEKALDAILGYGFKYELDGDFVRVYTTEEYKKKMEDPARMVHKVISLYYIKADEAVKLIQPLLSVSAKVTASTPAQSKISGGEGGSLTSTGGGDDLASNDMLIILDYPEYVAKAEAVLRDIDVRPKQVLIEATIMAARLTEDMEFGIDWNLLSGEVVNRAIINSANGFGSPIQTFGFAKPDGSTGLTAGFTTDNVRAVITALEGITDTTLLANPKILAVNKQEGKVYIGRKIGYQNQTTTTLTGGTTASVDFLETGTLLVFRPYIGDDGYIRMDIYPKDSDGSLKQNNIPDETSTELRTNVMVKDGETVVIGGLFRDSVITSKSQVPVLGSLPVVGALFRSKTDRVGREEVIIILTPHIIEDPAETRPDKRVNDMRRKRDAAKDSLEWIDSARLAEDAYARAAQYYLEGDVEKAVFNLKIALMMRPTYLEALRLRERIVAETDPEQFKRLDSITTEEINQQEAENWLRR